MKKFGLVDKYVSCFYNLLIHYMGWAYLKHFLKLVVSVNPIEKYKEQLSIKTGSIRIHNGAHLWH